MNANGAQQSDGVLYRGDAVTHYDTREMPWEEFEGYRNGYVKILSRFESGKPEAFLVYTPRGVLAPNEPHRHYHNCREYNFVLFGEFTVWEYETPEQKNGELLLLKPGYFMERKPGINGIHGVEPGVGSDTGCLSLCWREEPGTFRDEPEWDTTTIQVPYPEKEGHVPTRKPAIGETVVYENECVRHIDTRAQEWQPHVGGSLIKPLTYFDTGEPAVYITWTPPGDSDLTERRRHRHNFGERSLQLDGERSIWEYESAEQAEGTHVRHKPGAFVERRAGSIHGFEPGTIVSPNGSFTFTWRDAPGSHPGEPAYETGSVEVPFP